MSGFPVLINDFLCTAGFSLFWNYPYSCKLCEIQTVSLFLFTGYFLLLIEKYLLRTVSQDLFTLLA